MRQICKKWIVAVLAALACTVLSGCLSSPVEDLYQLPQLPREYTALSEVINTVLADGAEYAAPISGNNLQPVQMMDIDGDGVEEALAFFRNTAAEKPLQIYIFSVQEETYVCTAVIEGAGTYINSVSYSDINGNGVSELIVGWKISADAQMLSMYGFVGGTVTEHISAAYSQYTLSDLDGDALQELVIFRGDEEGGAAADYYNWQNEAVEMAGTARISSSLAELNKISAGILRDGTKALFISGIGEGNVMVTDILVMKDDVWSNISLQDSTGVSSVIFHFMSLYPKDVNGDGVTEVPQPVPMLQRDEDEVYYAVEWCSYDSRNEPQEALTTYHNTTDSWYLILPEEWDGEVTVSRSRKYTDQMDVSFYYFNDATREWVEFMVISKMTGDNREYRASRGGNTVIFRQSDAVYAVRYPEETPWRETMDAEEVKSNFGLILSDWSTGMY